MHPAVFDAFDEICRERRAGGRVLEVGATASLDTLLMLPSLRGAAERVGINMQGPWEIEGLTIHGGNANDMPRFADGSFDTVVCNATLEHDPWFWRSLAEMRRVLKPGGLAVIGVPAFDDLGMARVTRFLRLLPLPRRLIEGWRASTLTLHLHGYPRDYYRFSMDACRTVLLEGLIETDVRRVLIPPRVIGAGIKPVGL